MAARKPTLAAHRDYVGSVEDISGVAAAADQVIDAAEIMDLVDTVKAHADDLDALPVLDDTATDDATKLWSAPKIIAYLTQQLTSIQGEVDALELILDADDTDFDTAQERLNELKRLAGLIGSLGIAQIDGLRESLDELQPAQVFDGTDVGTISGKGVKDALAGAAFSQNQIIGLDTDYQRKPTVERWHATFRRSGAIDGDFDSLGVSGAAVLSDTSLYTITLDSPVPDGAYIYAVAVESDESIRSIGSVTLTNSTTVEVRTLNSTGVANYTAWFRLEIQSGRAGPRSVDAGGVARGSDAYLLLLAEQPVTTQDAQYADTLVVTNLAANNEGRTTDILTAVDYGGVAKWTATLDSGQQSRSIKQFSGDVVIDEDMLTNQHPVIYEITDGSLIIRAGGGTRNEFGLYKNILVRRIGSTPGPAIRVTSTGDSSPTGDAVIRWAMSHIGVLESTGGGFVFETVFSGVIHGLWAYNCVGDGVAMGKEIATPSAYGCNSIHIYGGGIGACSNGVVLNDTKAIGLHGMSIEGNEHAGVFVEEGNESVSIDSCYFENNATADALSTGVDIKIGVLDGERNQGTTIQNSWFSNVTSKSLHDYAISAHSTGDPINIHGNKFHLYAAGNPIWNENGAPIEIGIGNVHDSSGVSGWVHLPMSGQSFSSGIAAYMGALIDYADDAAAASGGVGIGELYRTGSTVKVRTV